MKFTSMGLFAAAMIAAAPASADVITFSDLPSGSCHFTNSQTANSGGFTFSANSGSQLFVCDAGLLANNTSPAIVSSIPTAVSSNVPGIISMSAIGGGAFSLNAFDAGTRTADFDPSTVDELLHGSTNLLVEGLRGGNVVASTSFAFSGTQFSTFLLSNAYTDLTSVRFTPSGITSDPEFVLDNVRVNEAFQSAVPEPATWAMMLIGFGAVGASMRRRKTTARIRFA